MALGDIAKLRIQNADDDPYNDEAICAALRDVEALQKDAENESANVAMYQATLAKSEADNKNLADHYVNDLGAELLKLGRENTELQTNVAELLEALDLWLRCHQDKLDADLGDRANNKLCPCFECKITREAIAKVKS